MARPLEVKIEWSAEGGNGANKACIPVVDEFGRFASVELPSLDVAEAWTQLANFPNPLEVDPPDEADGSCLESQEHSGSRSIEARYPIRQMMELIENIALRQTSIKEQDWTAWCIRLEQTLSQVADSPVVKAFQNMKVNPLHPLMQKCFRPKYAECGDTPEGRAYETVVGKIESNWGMAKVSKLGALHD